jgi:dolichol-phosphate mannosyltransferase
MTSLIIIPTYNEAMNIKEIIKQVLNINPSYHILIIDDNSPDHTAAIVRKLKNQNKEKIFLIERSKKLGLASAYISGFKWTLHRHYDNIITMDCDFSHDPKEIPSLIKKLDDFDLIIGSRYINGIRIINWPIRRLLLSYCASKYVRVLLNFPFKDPTGGFNAYSKKVLQSLDLNKIFSTGYCFQIEMKFKIYKKHFKIYEHPIIFHERRDGQSKMSNNIIFEAIFNVIKMKFLSLKKNS